MQPGPGEDVYSNTGASAEIKKKTHKRITSTPNVSIHTFIQDEQEVSRINERLESMAQLPLGMSIDQSTLMGLEDARLQSVDK